MNHPRLFTRQSRRSSWRQVLAGAFVALLPSVCIAQISTTLTDAIYQGAGTMNLLTDITAAQFKNQITSDGRLFFGVDINENASGNESNDSIGVALKQVTLVVQTTTGTYSFSNFATDTTSMIQAAGTTGLSSYYTMFGQGGSSSLTGATPGFDLSIYDDVLTIQNIAFTGDVLSAQMSVTLLNTGNAKTSNETFFDYSGGFEDFALLSLQDALLLEQASIGTSAAPTEITFSAQAPVITDEYVSAQTAGVAPETSDTPDPSPATESTAASTPPPMTPPPAAPLPPAGILMLAVLLSLVARKNRSVPTVASSTLHASE